MNEIESTDDEWLKTITLKIEELGKHTSLKNFNGPSKSMETDANVQLFLCAPKKVEVFWKQYSWTIIQQQSLHTRRPWIKKQKLLTLLSFVNICVVANPSHRKRTIPKWYFGLAGKHIKEYALTPMQVKKLTQNFGHFQKQIKEMTLHGAEVAREAGMLHLSGTHDKYGNLCLENKAGI